MTAPVLLTWTEVGPDGRGVADARLGTDERNTTVRVHFVTPEVGRPLPGASQADADSAGAMAVGFAAVAAVATHLRARGFTGIRLTLRDPRVVDVLSADGADATRLVPPSLAPAYIKARAALMAYAERDVRLAGPPT